MSKRGLFAAVRAAAIQAATPGGVPAQPIGRVRNTEGTLTLQRAPRSLSGVAEPRNRRVVFVVVR